MRVDEVHPDELRASFEDLVRAVHTQGGGDEMIVTLLRVTTDLVRMRRPQGDALTDDQAAFLVESGTFSAESLAATETRVARGELAALERKTRLEAITESLSATEVAERLGIDASRVRHRLGKGLLYAFTAGGKRRYPTWQFTNDPRQPVLPGLGALVRALPEGMHPSSVLNFMAAPQDDLVVRGNGLTPTEWLTLGGDPDAVIELLDAFLQW